MYRYRRRINRDTDTGASDDFCGQWAGADGSGIRILDADGDIADLTAGGAAGCGELCGRDARGGERSRAEIDYGVRREMRAVDRQLKRANRNGSRADGGDLRRWVLERDRTAGGLGGVGSLRCRDGDDV